MNPWRRTALKVEGNPEVVDTGPGRHVRLRNLGSDPLFLSTFEKASVPMQTLAPGETIVVTTRVFAWSSGRARVQVLEYEGDPDPSLSEDEFKPRTARRVRKAVA